MQLRKLKGHIRRYKLPSPVQTPTSPQIPNIVSKETPTRPINIMEEEKHVRFKEIKLATEAMSLVVPKFSGENKNEFVAHWTLVFTKEANHLALGKQLGSLVLPRLLTGKASERCQSIPDASKADPKSAMEEPGKILGNQAARNKALNNLPEIRNKPSESLFSFGIRISDNVKVAHPKLLPSEREEMAVHHFVNGLPSELKIKLKEGEQYKVLNKAVERATLRAPAAQMQRVCNGFHPSIEKDEKSTRDMYVKLVEKQSDVFNEGLFMSDNNR